MLLDLTSLHSALYFKKDWRKISEPVNKIARVKRKFSKLSSKLVALFCDLMKVDCNFCLWELNLAFLLPGFNVKYVTLGYSVLIYYQLATLLTNYPCKVKLYLILKELLTGKVDDNGECKLTDMQSIFFFNCEFDGCKKIFSECDVQIQFVIIYLWNVNHIIWLTLLTSSACERNLTSKMYFWLQSLQFCECSANFWYLRTILIDLWQDFSLWTVFAN